MPSFGQIAAFQLHIAGFITPAARIQIAVVIREIAHHFRRREFPQALQVTARPGGIHLNQALLKRLIILRRHLDIAGGRGIGAACNRGSGTAHWRGFHLARIAGRPGHGRRGLAAAEQAESEPNQPANQRHLKQHAKHGAEAADTAEQPAAQEHADQAAHQQTTSQRAHEGTLRLRLGRHARAGCGARLWGGRLGCRTLHRPRGIRRGLGRRRRAIGAAATAAGG